MHSLDACVPEKSKRRLVETDCYLRYPPLQVFAGTQVERDTSPTPVIYLQLAGDVGLGIRIRSYVRLLAIRPDGLAQDGAGIVLAAHCVLERLRRIEWTYRLNHFRLFRPNRIGIEGDRRLYRRHCQELKYVIWDHVAQRAGLLIKLSPLLDPDSLGSGNLNVINVFSVPDRLEQTIGEP